MLIFNTGLDGEGPDKTENARSVYSNSLVCMDTQKQVEIE